MCAYYKLVKTPNPKKDGMITPYHARFVNKTTTRMEEVLNKASNFSSFSSSDIIGVLDVLKQVIVMELSYGRNVELKDFATFTASLNCPPLYNKKDIQTQDISFKTIKIRAAADFKNKLKQRMFIYKEPEINAKIFYPHQRRKILLEELQEKNYITAKTYRDRTNLCKNKAAKELNEYIKEGLIVKCGNGPTTFYMLKELHTFETD